MRIDVPKTNFTGGEISPFMYARQDLEAFHKGLKLCKNAITGVVGGVDNRPGTQHVAETLGGATGFGVVSNLIGFKFKETQALVLEFGHYGLRPLLDKGLILKDMVDSALYRWTISGSGTAEYYLELAAGGDPSQLFPAKVLEDDIKMVEGSLGSLTAGQWAYGNNDTLGFQTIYVRLSDSLDPDSKATGYIKAPAAFISPYPLSAVHGLGYTQSADTMYLTHLDYPTYKLTRNSNTDWVFTKVPFIDGPYKAFEKDDGDISVNATYVSGDLWDLKASATIFADTEVGDHVRLGFPIPGLPESLYWNWFIVTVATSSTIVRAEVQGDKNVVLEQVANPDFKNGINFWQDTTLKASTGAKLTYDKTAFAAVLTESGTGAARMEQAVVTLPNKGHRLTIDVTLAGTPPNVINVHIGTTSGGTEDDPTTPIVITSSGVYTFDIRPTTANIYLSLNTTGSTSGVVATFSSISVIPIDTLVANPAEHSTNAWRVGLWNSINGYPSVASFFKGRLVLANTLLMPQTVWFSRVEDYENNGFSTPLIDSDAIAATLDSKEINAIRAMIPKEDLVLVTEGGIWKVAGSRETGVLSPTSIEASFQNKISGSSIPPVVIDESIILAPRGQTSLKEITYSNETAGYPGRDLTVLAEHLFKGVFKLTTGPPIPGSPSYTSLKIIDMAYAESPSKVLWCVRNDGTLLGLTYSKEHNVFGWHQHTTSGAFGVGFLNVCTIPGEYNEKFDTVDDVYFVVRRVVPTYPFYTHHIECFNQRITAAVLYDYSFLDNSVSYDDSLNPISTMYGLDHLLGRTVTALADGNVVSGLTVTDFGGGNIGITLPLAAGLIHVGQPFKTEIEQLDLESTGNTGTTLGKEKSVISANIYVKDTRNLKVGYDEATEERLVLTDEEDSDLPTPLRTGVYEIPIENDLKKTKGLYMSNELPVPMSILATITRLEVKGG